MASAREKQRIKSLAAEGQSVNTIKDKLGLPKSTVYYHFKKEVGQKQKENRLEIPDDPEFKEELCGIFAGDGNFHRDNDGHYRIRIFLNLNDEYWKILADHLEEKLSKRPRIYQYEDKTRETLSYYSKALYLFLKQKLDWDKEKGASIRLKEVEELSEDFKIGFLRGFVDTDGHRYRDCRHYKMGSISGKLMNQISYILTDLGIDNSLTRSPDKRQNCRDMYRVKIYGDDAESFGRDITPRHPKKDFENYYQEFNSLETV